MIHSQAPIDAGTEGVAMSANATIRFFGTAAGSRLNGHRKREHSPFVYVAALLVLLTIHCDCRGEDARRDGNWWAAQTDANKVGYMTGFFDGLILEQRIFDATLLNVAPPKFNQQFVEFASNVEIQANTQMERLFTRVTAAQMRDGLNNFYSDARNRRVLLFNAAFVVANAFAGSPMERVEDLAATYRVSDTK
jgi:hypothetical protein